MHKQPWINAVPLPENTSSSFRAGPIADTWHLLTWKPLDCDCGSMALLHPSPHAALTPLLLSKKTSLLGCLFFLPISDTDRSIDLWLSEDDVDITAGWQRVASKDASVVFTHLSKSLHSLTAATHEYQTQINKLWSPQTVEDLCVNMCLCVRDVTGRWDSRGVCVLL